MPKDAPPNGDAPGVDVDPALMTGRQLCERLAARGVLAKDTHGSTLRLAPPLAVTPAEIDRALAKLADVTDAPRDADQPPAPSDDVPGEAGAPPPDAGFGAGAGEPAGPAGAAAEGSADGAAQDDLDAAPVEQLHDEVRLVDVGEPVLAQLAEVGDADGKSERHG